MASVYRSRRTLESQSGGKIVRPRRVARVRTPYDRPRLTNPDPENPNWLSRLATGAGKIISSVFGPDSDSDSSSSSGDETDDDGEECDDNPTQEDDGLNQRNGTSEKINLFRSRPSTVGKSDNKNVIEQLVMQETFSREECDRLIKIIKSRVVGFSIFEDAENTRTNVDITPDLCGTAVTEAKKWLKEKRLGSASKSDLDRGTSTLSSLMFPQGAEDEGGSPVDVAKFYMRARPPWASPSIKHGELRSPSSVGMQLFNDEIPYSTGGNSVSTSKLKRDSQATGSWNIQEEIRRVRSKATEEMLRSLPSTRIDWSTSTLGNRSTLDSLPDGKQDEIGVKVHNFKNSVDVNVNFSSGLSTSDGYHVLDKTQYGLQKEALPLPAISFEQNQDMDVTSIDGKAGSQNALDLLRSGQHKASADMKTALSNAGDGDFNGSDQQNSAVGGTIHVPDSELHGKTCSTTEATESRSCYATNGFPSSVASLSAQPGTEENAMLNGEANPASSNHEKVTINVTVEETHEIWNEITNEVSNKNENDGDGTKETGGALLNEGTLEVPESENNMDLSKDDGFVASGSQNSSSLPDDLSQELTQPNLQSTPTTKTSGVGEKQKGKRLTRYNRRGRARGK